MLLGSLYREEQIYVKNNSSKFEKNYFTGYYRDNVGSFGIKDLQRSLNWFHGWFKHLESFVDFTKGNGRKVLEVGCSMGGASFLLADRGFTVFASDISKYALEKAKKLAKLLGKNISFYTFDVQKDIPIREKFDIICAFEVIEHLEKPEAAIKNMRSKLKTNGVLICSTPNGEHAVSDDPTHINIKSALEWKKIFESAGFKDIQLNQVSFLPFFYKFSKRFHVVIPVAIYSKYINSPLFIVAKN